MNKPFPLTSYPQKLTWTLSPKGAHQHSQLPKSQRKPPLTRLILHEFFWSGHTFGEVTLRDEGNGLCLRGSGNAQSKFYLTKAGTSLHSHGQEHSCAHTTICQICKPQEQPLHTLFWFLKVRGWPTRSHIAGDCTCITFLGAGTHCVTSQLWTHKWPAQVAGKGTACWVLLAHPAEKDTKKRKFFLPPPGGMLKRKDNSNSKLSTFASKQEACSCHFASGLKSGNTECEWQLGVPQWLPKPMYRWTAF